MLLPILNLFWEQLDAVSDGMSTRVQHVDGSSVPEMSGFRKSCFPKVRTGVFVSLSTRRSAGAVGSRQADRNIFRACADSKYISLLTVPVQVVRRNADSGGTELASIRATCSGDIKPVTTLLIEWVRKEAVQKVKAEPRTATVSQ